TMYSWTPIGTKDKPFAGTFDGNGHTISGLYFENTTNSNYPDGGNYVGLIGYAKGSGGNGAIKNVGVIDSYIHGCQYVGGICGQAGVFTYDGYFPITITNCYNTGTISGSSSYVGGICGYEGTTTNCYNTGTVSGSDEYVGGICGCSGAQINCYYLAGCGSKNTLGVSATTAEFESGKITYLLNGRTSGDDNTWRQNRGGDADAYPVLDKNHLVVYASQPCTVTFSNTEGAVIPHSSVDEITGYCPVCCQFTVHGTLVTESNRNSLNLTANFVGYYAISNSGELYWFANEVNSGNNTINAVLTADIEVNKNLLNDDGTVNGTPTNWAPIGSFYDFRGTFDGNGHTISGLYFSEPTIDNVGLIGFAYRATIKNVGVIDSYLHGHNSVGGICGYDYYLSKITNCYNTGSVSGYDGVGGIYGYSDDYSTTATNCFNTGSVSGYDGVGGIVGAGNTPTNCYYLADCGSKNTLGTSATAEEFANGKITYLLNGSTSEGNLTWRQTLGDGNDAHPVLDKTHAVVYATQPCASGFSNTSGDVNPHPSSMDAIGRCTACGKFIAQGTLVTESNYSSLNLSADFVGYYAISNSGELYWLANEVNNGNATINAVLTADIVVNENVLNADGTLNGTPTYSWTPIGTYSKNYKGTFDGNGHTISGLYFNNTANSNYPDGGINVGLIGYANGAEIKNVGVINSYLVGRYYVGGICGYGSSSTTITNCYNTGTVWGDTNYGGGICGFGSSSTTITNCYNTGTITGFHYVGGICSSGGTQTNCHNTGKVSGTYYVGGICGSGGTQTNCYYLSGCATGGINVVQYGVGNGTWGQTTADVAGKTTAATAEEFASGKIGYLLNTNNNNAWHQNLYSDGYPVLDNTHNFVSGYIEEEGDTYTVVGDMFLATNYEVAAGKTLSVPAGTSLTTTGEAVITNNGTIVFNGTIAGNNLAGNGTFITNRLSLCSISNLSESYVYKGSAYTLEDGLQDVAVNTTILGKTFTLDATISSPSYTNNRYVGTATISWTNNADENDVLSGRFEITPKEVELVWKNTTLTYNGSAQKPTATATGMVNDESLAVSVSGAQTNAGTYTATATGLSNSNYKLPTTVTQQFSIEPKTGVVVTITENSSELAYNTEEQSVSGYTVSIDDELGIYSENDFEFSGTAAVAGTTVGTYPMELSAADFSNTNANFADVEFVIVDGALTINKAPEAPNKPEAAMSTLFVNTQLIELPAGWAWTESKALEEGANTAIAEYTGADAGNYEIERVEIAITRNHCDHNGETAMLYIVEATCTEQGYSGNLSCALCGEIYEYGHTTDALGHDFVNTIVAPTCTAEGYTQHLCSRCQHVEYSDTVAANGHKADSIVFENIVAATCTVAGSKDSVVYCSVCKAELSRKTVVIDATGHKADSVIFENIVAATCSAAGSKDSVVYCSVCKAEVSRTKVTLPATGHTVVVDSAVAATATTDGLTEGSHCSVCGETIVAQEVIPATGEQGGEENGNEGGNENNGGNNQGGNENNGGNENQGGNNEGGNENQGGENTEPATAIADDAAPAVNIYAYQNIIVVENATDEIRVYNAMGTLVYRDAARHISTTATITVNGQGVYIVKTGNVAKRVMIY
ncbi:MAG: hypothetical protein J6U13_00750, partial [Salinivirgaceae bacterium]|nr:hypothetical protein [Salinivirgaceae bacterium]